MLMLAYAMKIIEVIGGPRHHAPRTKHSQARDGEKWLLDFEHVLVLRSTF